MEQVKLPPPVKRAHAGQGLISPNPSDAGKFIFRRNTLDEVFTNVPVLVVVHSPTGLEWGYGGSGPSDLAINILEYTLRDMGYAGERRDYSLIAGSVFEDALVHAYDFKIEFIVPMPDEGGVIELATVREWIATRISEVAQ